MPDLGVDCLLGTVGLLPDEITHRQVIQAATLPETFAARAEAWWKREKPAAFKDIAERNLDTLFEKVSAEPLQADVTQWLASAGDEDEHIQDLYLALKQARRYLVDAWPRIQIQTFAGTRLAALSVDDAAEVGSLFAVLNEPTRVLDEMDAGTLSPSQATAFRQVYPALYDHYRQALWMGAAKQTEKNEEWVPDESEEIALAILTGMPTGALPYEADEAAKEAPKPSKDLGASAVRTQADQSSKPVGVK